MYASGQGVLADYSQAMALCRKAVEQGYVGAMNNLAVMYADSLGVPKDEEEAYFWWLLASGHGDLTARKNRDLIATRLSPVQRDNARARAVAWIPNARTVRDNDSSR